ncbi:hypothetical protein ACFOEK_19050 [Litoribrevibacter euphylliae]|uniref:GGDEF domain-containing protein n=1 Tax=Litoribrevibacter euphylliae TaxID=1834034 RepID=A0ABV7HK82_9GAMM
MKTPGFDTLVFASRKLETFIALTIIIAVFSVILMIRADNLLSSQSILLTIPLTAILILLSFQKPSRRREISGVTIVIALFALTVILPFLLRSQLSPWIYLIPVLLINFMTFRLNLIAIGIYAAIIFTLLSFMADNENALPTSLSFLFVCALCLIMAFLKDQMLLRLTALDIFHKKTGWHLRQELKPSLDREIQRAEREGSGLSYSLIEFPSDTTQGKLRWNPVKQFVHSSIRPFDQVFHYSHRKIAIIHPYATKDEIKSRLEASQQKHPDVTFKAGITSLNIGDNSTEVISKGRAALLCCTENQQVLCHEA